MKLVFIIIIILLIIGIIYVIYDATKCELAIKWVNLEKYMGLWYEIVRSPSFFQRDCIRSTARYTLLPNNNVEIFNECIQKSGETISMRGTGKLVNDETINVDGENLNYGQLLVNFEGLYQSYYNILYVDPDYQYAIVGSCDKRYMWVLSRNTQNDISIINNLVTYAGKLGYPIDNAIYTNYDQSIN